MTIGSVAGERAAVIGVVDGIVRDMPFWRSCVIFVRTTERLERGDGRERGWIHAVPWTLGVGGFVEVNAG